MHSSKDPCALLNLIDHFISFQKCLLQNEMEYTLSMETLLVILVFLIPMQNIVVPSNEDGRTDTVIYLQKPNTILGLSQSTFIVVICKYKKLSVCSLNFCMHVGKLILLNLAVEIPPSSR